MAYFDSPKNSAIWEKEMIGLRAERARREAEGYKPNQPEEAQHSEKAAAKENNNPNRRRINLAELERIEQMANGVHRVKRPTRERARTMEMRQAEKEQTQPQRRM